MTNIQPAVTVSDMAAIISQANQKAVPSPIWIEGTLASWKRTRTWGTGELVSYNYQGKATAKLQLGVPGNIAAGLESKFRKGGTDLAAGLNIRVLARPELHPLYGLRLNVVTIDSQATVSQDRRNYETLLEHVMTSGLADQQRHLTVQPRPGQTLGLISPSGGDAAREDVLGILRTLKIAPREIRVPMSGPNARTGLPSAIHRLNDNDVILMIRGGGDASDIAVFNDERIVLAVTASPVPIIVGIGHATDNPLVQLVAHHSADTPTAAAQWAAENFAGIQPAIPAPLQAEPVAARPAPSTYQQPAPARNTYKVLVGVIAVLTVLIVLLLIF